MLDATTPPATVLDLLAAPSGSVALSSPGRPDATYDVLRGHVERTVAGLNERGLGRNDRVAIMLPNGPEMAGAFVSVAAGAATAPLNPACKESEFAFHLEDLGAKALLLMEGDDSPARRAARELGVQVLDINAQAEDPAGTFRFAAPAGDAMARRDPSGTGAPDPAGDSFSRHPTTPSTGFARPGDVALVLHTSGTTSRPKIVPLLHRNVCASALHIRETLALGPSDRCLNVMPLFHIHGLVACVLASLAAGAGVYCAPGFNALRFFAWMDDCAPTWYSAVPTMHQAVLARAARNPKSVARAALRFVRSSSAALPVRVIGELEKTFGVPVVEAYAMTEASHQMTCNPLPPARRKPGTVGPAAGPEVSVVDEAGNHLATNQTGEIVVRGPNVTPGYENNNAANEAAFFDGWFRTGDQGHRDEDGYFTVTGRLKEIINRGGEKVSPREVDEVLMDHPAVEQAVTFAVPHPKLGEEVAAAVVLKKDGGRAEARVAADDRGADDDAPAALRAFASTRLAAFKVPRRVLVMDEIPKGPTGKLRRIGLAEQLGLVQRMEASSQRTATQQPEPTHEPGPPQ